VLPTIREVFGERRALHTVPDDQVALALDVTPWLEQKIAAVMAHRAEVERGALPGLVAGLPPTIRERLLGTEWYTVRPLRPGATTAV
jgi:N-acetyl-1-D-myo-inositol-2-amino-2-deoxy-alpha-D-glucopyranoside deacetylase